MSRNGIIDTQFVGKPKPIFYHSVFAPSYVLLDLTMTTPQAKQMPARKGRGPISISLRELVYEGSLTNLAA